MAVPKLLFGKLSTGSAPDLSGSTPIDTVGLEVTRYDGTTKEHELDRNIIGNVPQSNVNPQSKVAFSVEAAGQGTAGTAPLYGMFLKAAGFAEVVDAGVDVTYSWAATGHQKVDMWDMRHGTEQLKQVVPSALGSVTYKMEAEDFPMFSFELTGDYNRPDAISAGDQAAIDAVDWTGWLEAAPMTKDNTPILTLDGVSACTKSFEIDFGIEALYRNWANCKTNKIVDIKPSGSMVIESPDINTKNWFEKAESHSVINKLPFVLEHDATAGRKVGITASEVQITNVQNGEDEGDAILTFDFSFLDVPEIIFS